MRITDALLVEHGVICRLLDHVERRAPGWSLGQAREASTLLAAALKAHAATEEELLFVRLERAIGHEPTPLAVLRLEHQEIEAIFARIALAESIGEFQPGLARLIELITDHFAKEEGFLIPLVHHYLDPETLELLGSRWSASTRLRAPRRSPP